MSPAEARRDVQPARPEPGRGDVRGSEASGALPAQSGPEPEPEPEPTAAAVVFGERLDMARRYVAVLATDGIVRGLIGPREATHVAVVRHQLACSLCAHQCGQ